MPLKVADIIGMVERLAPPRLAEEWDNCGLQIGDPDRPARRVWVALDPSPGVIDAARENGVDLLVTHHPLFFKPLKSIDFGSQAGSIIRKAATGNLAIYSAHTSYDSAEGGVSDILAERIGLKNVTLFGKPDDSLCKLVFYVPAESERKFLNALFETEAGKIGEYTRCSFRNPGTGTFMAAASSKPFIGRPGEASETGEIRIETVVRQSRVSETVAHAGKHHPYETMAYDVYPLADSGNGHFGMEGLGRIGDLEKPATLSDFVVKLKEKLNVSRISHAGNPDLVVAKAAVCSGSGSSLMKRFLASPAQVYISGDLRYHDARDAEEAGRGLVDIGHFASEFPAVEALGERLKRMVSEKETNVAVDVCRIEKDPFRIG